MSTHAHAATARDKNDCADDRNGSFTDRDKRAMMRALELAERAMEKNEVPCGCVIVQKRGDEIIAEGYNRTNETRNATKHAEFVALEELMMMKAARDDANNANAIDRGVEMELFVTCEPCIMCAQMLKVLPITRVVYGCANDKFGGCGTCLSANDDSRDGERGCCGIATGERLPESYEVIGGLFADEAVQLFQRFYVRGNPKAPVPHRKVLLDR